MLGICARVGAVTLLLIASNACGDDDDDQGTVEAESGHGESAGSGGKSGGNGAADAGNVHADAGSARDAGGGAAELDPQVPPADSDEVERWLAQGFYKDWTCEDEPTAKTFGAAAIHVHGGKSLVCTNALLSKATRSGDAEFPKGVASVKDFYDADGKQIGTAVAVKVAAKSDGGRGWYWWEGKTNSGLGAKVCVGCHAAAGSDDDHPGAGDYVYFRN